MVGAWIIARRPFLETVATAGCVSMAVWDLKFGVMCGGRNLYLRVQCNEEVPRY
jgi:hypothetical protein